MEITVEAQKREPGSKAKALRRSGLVPANVYGHQGTESIGLTLDAKTVEKLLRDATINNTIIDLNIADLPWRGTALLREVQNHPWKGYPYHLSFYAVSATKSLQVTVPLHFVGDSVGVKQNGGILDPVLTEIEVECVANAIPETIEVNVSQMQIGDAIHISDLALPAGVKAVAEASQLVVSVLQGSGGSAAGESA